MDPNPTTTRIKCGPMRKVAFPFITLIAITSFSYLCCNAERTKTSYDAFRIPKQLTDRHGNFLEHKDGITKFETIESVTPLGRNMPTDVKHHKDIYMQDDVIGRISRQVGGNRKAWLDRYKEMLNRWEKNNDDSSSNVDENYQYGENPSTPILKDTYVIPDSSSVSVLISGGDKYKQVSGRNNGNLEYSLSDDKIIEGLQRLMTSTTKRTTRPYHRSTYQSPFRNRWTTISTYQQPVTEKVTTTTTTKSPKTTTYAVNKYGK